MNEWLWLIQWIATSIGPSVVPILFVMLLEWPWHFWLSAFGGYLGCLLMYCGCRRAFGPLSQGVELYLKIYSVFFGLCVALSVHRWLDYGQDIIPAGVR